MSGRTKIGWADASWSPVTGCTKVSAGCAHCYAERQAKRFAGRFGYPAEHPFALTMRPERLDEPLHWRKARRVFVCSMSDLFHSAMLMWFAVQVWKRMEAASRHTFLVLTKRPSTMAENVGPMCRYLFGKPFLPNVWLGTSIEDQATANERIPHLLRCPAAVRFVCYEPALGPVDFCKLPHDPGGDVVLGSSRQLFVDALRGYWHNDHQTKLDWVIAGGESGPNARPAHPDWFRSVRDQCQAADVPFFFKQWGEWTPVPCRGNSFSFDGLEKYHVWDLENVSRRVAKKAAGRLLDGVEHNAYPGEAEG